MSESKPYQELFAGDIGDVYSVTPEFMGSRVMKAKPMRGEVVFIPKHRRYAVLAFPGVHGTSREAFWPEELKAKCKRAKGDRLCR